MVRRRTRQTLKVPGNSDGYRGLGPVRTITSRHKELTDEHLKLDNAPFTRAFQIAAELGQLREEEACNSQCNYQGVSQCE